MKKSFIATIIILFCCNTIFAQRIASSVKISEVVLKEKSKIDEIQFDINGKTLRIDLQGSDANIASINLVYPSTPTLINSDYMNLTYYENKVEKKATLYYNVYSFNNDEDFKYLIVTKNGTNNSLYQIAFSNTFTVDNIQSNEGKRMFAIKTEFEYVGNQVLTKLISVIDYYQGQSGKWWEIVPDVAQGNPSFTVYGEGDGKEGNYNFECIVK